MNLESALGYLRLISPDGSERVITIAYTPFCLGRGPHNELTLTDQSISGHHACLSRQGRKFQVVDVGSENGTWIGATRLETNQPYVLDYNEIFRLGPYQLRLEPASVASGPLSDKTVPTVSVAAGALEAETAVGSSPPIEPLGEPFLETSPDEHLAVMLRTPQMAVLPGHTANISLVIANQNEQTDWFRVSLMGVPDVWLVAPSPLIELSPQGRQEVNLTIQPPLAPDSRAGQYRLTIQVTSQNHPTESVIVHANLIVEPYSAFDSRLSVPRIGINDVAQVIVRNGGNAPQTFTVTWDDPEDRYEFRPAETQLTLSAGETSAAEFRAVPHHRRWLGATRVDVYSIKVAAQTGPDQTHTGQVITTGLMPTWAVALFMLAAMCGVASGAAALGLLGTAPDTTPTPTVTLAPTVTPLSTLRGVRSLRQIRDDRLPYLQIKD